MSELAKETKEAAQAGGRMSENLEIIYKDSNGKIIKEGAILKVFHFTGSRNKKHYMYKIAALKDGHLVAMDILELLQLGKERAHTCRLQALPLSGTEIIQQYD